MLTAMEDPQHHQTLAVKGISEHIGSVQDRQDQFPKFGAAIDGTSKQRMVGDDLCSGQNFGSDDPGEPGMPIVQKISEAVEIGKRRTRPLKLH